jgi:hypothetical protein
MDVNIYLTKDYENETAFRPQKNKPKQSQFLEKAWYRNIDAMDIPLV